ncbi:MAG: hypothetical protein KatS3mg085_716 [Candidatus Dojkabacteria bacterium]|nr:MAG: hypothetical protein KatS3mg085_716 [Candidatus Dojkabacteria bacterium]
MKLFIFVKELKIDIDIIKSFIEKFNALNLVAVCRVFLKSSKYL